MKVIVVAILTAVVLTTVLIEVFTVTSTISRNAEQTASYRERLIDDIKNELKNETQEAMSICAVMNSRYEAMLLYRKDYFRVPKDHDMVASLIMPTFFDTRFIKGDMHYDLSRLKFAEEGCDDVLYLKTETERLERIIQDSKKTDSELVAINELLVSKIQRHKEESDSRHHIAQDFVPCYAPAVNC